MANQRKLRPKIKQATKVRSILQQEINSICPFCDNTEVGHFEIHHIDENPQNNLISNLLLLCPTCHSKITKGDILQKLVFQTKNELLTTQQIECASIAIDKTNCSWDNYENFENAFISTDTNKSPYPIFSFSLINLSQKTVLMKEIQLQAKHLFSGLSGIPRPIILKSLTKFKIKLPNVNETNVFKLVDEIEVPKERAFKFQVQLFSHWDNEDYPIKGRKVLYFTFKFNNSISITAPTIFLNCKSDNEKLTISYLD